MGPPDPIVGLNEAYALDASKNKVNVGVGAYRGDDGLPFVLPVIREAEKIILSESLNHEYLGIAGDPDFVNLALEFVYGKESPKLKEGCVAAAQTLSGTGGLRVFGELLVKGGYKSIYLPNKTWGNHIPIFKNSGLDVKKYSYYDSAILGLDFSNLISDLKDIPENNVVLLHACAHNPTGVDPSSEQWAEISRTMKDRNLIPFFDCAYQGFASGNAEKDAFAIRKFVEDGHLLATVQSFSKNFGLYGQRVGVLSILTTDANEAKRVLSQLKMTIRPMYSNPPRQGAQLVKTILQDEDLSSAYLDQCAAMAERIQKMRYQLRSVLENGGSHRNWEHITSQIGMFAYSGLSEEEVISLRDDHHIYCTLDGRISMAGVTSGNVDYIGNAIREVSNS